MSNLPLPPHAISITLRIVVVVLAAALISETSTGLKALTYDTAGFWETARVVTTFWFGVLPQAFYLLAAWAASGVFGRLGRGDGFGPSLVKGLRDTGGHMVYGAAAAIVIVPTLMPMLDDRFRGIRYDAEIESFTIGLIGVVLYLLAKQGQRLKSELEQFV